MARCFDVRRQLRAAAQCRVQFGRQSGRPSALLALAAGSGAGRPFLVLFAFATPASSDLRSARAAC